MPTEFKQIKFSADPFDDQKDSGGFNKVEELLSSTSY